MSKMSEKASGCVGSGCLPCPVLALPPEPCDWPPGQEWDSVEGVWSPALALRQPCQWRSLLVDHGSHKHSCAVDFPALLHSVKHKHKCWSLWHSTATQEKRKTVRLAAPHSQPLIAASLRLSILKYVPFPQNFGQNKIYSEYNINTDFKVISKVKCVLFLCHSSC